LNANKTATIPKKVRFSSDVKNNEKSSVLKNSTKKNFMKYYNEYDMMNNNTDAKVLAGTKPELKLPVV
jgi:hypothetical protein